MSQADIVNLMWLHTASQIFLKICCNLMLQSTGKQCSLIMASHMNITQHLIHMQLESTRTAQTSLIMAIHMNIIHDLIQTIHRQPESSRRTQTSLIMAIHMNIIHDQIYIQLESNWRAQTSTKAGYFPIWYCPVLDTDKCSRSLPKSYQFILVSFLAFPENVIKIHE